MPYTTYSSLNNLDEFTFTAGTTYYLDFKVYNEEGIAVGITGALSFSWKCAPYGQKDYTVISKINSDFTVLDDDYTVRLTLSPSDTQNLSGKYVHQITVSQTIDATTTIFKPGQGTFTVSGNITN